MWVLDYQLDISPTFLAMADVPIAEVIDRLAQEPTPRIFASIKPPSSCRRDMSYREFSDLVNTAALWLDSNLPHQTSSRTLAYIGNIDLRRMALLVACAKSSRQILMVRRYISEEAMKNLVSASGCDFFLYDCEEDKPRLKTQHPHKSHHILPPWESWLESTDRVQYVPVKTREQSMDDALCIFHTSGSTGAPKPIIATNRKIAMHARMSYMGEQMKLSGRRLVSSFPSSHAGGVGWSLFMCVYLGMIPVFPESSAPVTLEDTLALLEAGRGDMLVAQPSILAAITRSKELLLKTQKLSYIVTGSAPFSKTDVDILQSNDGPQVINYYASTEMWPLATNIPGRDDWPYVSFRAESGVRFHHEQDDLFELVIEKSNDATAMQPVFTSFPDITAYHSRDLFCRQPKDPDLWRFCGRKDDLVSLASGQGINVGPMERAIMECPLVDTAIIGEDGRPVSVLLVVPHAGESEAELHDSLWPYIVEANMLCHPAGAVQKDMVLVPPTREHLTSVTEKGTLNRRQTLREFAKEVEAMYKRT